MLNVDGNQPQGDFVVVDKSDGTLKVYEGEPPAKGEEAVGPARRTIPRHHRIGSRPASARRHGRRRPIRSFRLSITSPTCSGTCRDDKAEQKLPPGPNGPVGVAWLDLTKEHYGIHGTQRASDYRHDGKPRLPAAHQLGRDAIVADDEAGFTAMFVA